MTGFHSVKVQAAHYCSEQPSVLLLLLARLFAAALASQSLLHSLLFSWLQVKRMTFDFFDNVFRLHLALKTAQSIFERFAILQSHFCQTKYTPKLSLKGLASYCKRLPISQAESGITVFLEYSLYGQLYLPGSIGAGGLKE